MKKKLRSAKSRGREKDKEGDGRNKEVGAT